MTFAISMPSEDDLASLPIIDITPPGLWIPSDFNESDKGLSFLDPLFDSHSLAQAVTRVHLDEEPAPVPDACPADEPRTTSIPEEQPIFHDSLEDLIPGELPSLMRMRI
jgi:hypothetical protein